MPAACVPALCQKPHGVQSAAKVCSHLSNTRRLWWGQAGVTGRLSVGICDGH